MGGSDGCSEWCGEGVMCIGVVWGGSDVCRGGVGRSDVYRGGVGRE